MATFNVNNPNRSQWAEIKLTANTDVAIQLANNGAYIGIFIGNATQSQIFTVLVGSSGNTSNTKYGSNTTLTITDGSGNAQITLRSTATRNVYIMPLNGAAPAKLAS